MSLERGKGLGRVGKWFDDALKLSFPEFSFIAFRIVFCAFIF